MIFLLKYRFALLLVFPALVFLACSSGSPYVPENPDNPVPDFSYCGYKGSETGIPDVPIRLILPVIEGDATDLIQAAIDHISTYPEDENGFRGAILFSKGKYLLEGRLTISSSGIVLRGSGMNEGGTVLIAGGTDRMTLVRIAGENDITIDRSYQLSEDYVPVGAKTIHTQGQHTLEQDDRVFIHRPSTQSWIDELSMNSFGGESSYLGWKPGERDIYWDRSITKVKGNTISLDAPLTTAIDNLYGGGNLVTFEWPGRICNVGIENMKMVSTYDTSNQKDEDHCWMAITMENIENAWVRRIEFSHFAGSAVAVYETASRVTIEDCISLSPVSEIGGQRRYTFFTMGQQCLFQRLYSEYGYHDFSSGFCAAGPNAFVECESYLPYSFSGAIDSWSSGLLFDIVKIDGEAIRFGNRGQDAMGAGWCAANSMLWQCSAALIECYNPPTADNWAHGCWSQFAGDGHWVESNSHIQPRSLYYEQLAKRLGRPVSDFSGEIMPFRFFQSTSPTPELAAELNRQAYEPAPSLEAYIRNAEIRDPIENRVDRAQNFQWKPVSKSEKEPAPPPVQLSNGWLVRQGQLLSGERISIPWWRGDARPYETVKARPAITRFVPGRYGHGYTDELGKVVEWMASAHVVALEHNYGLWYDRRRDDHQRVRRMDGEVWAPFYEQPFARSGRETAWDGLSKYDLTRYNKWYWKRLREFANEGEARGVLLLHHQYFQHNILEAGAHYADFPWRTANNINSTGFPEPPPYAADKRIFMDGQFYDTLHPARRDLHREYIRKCLDNFSDNTNVIHLLSAEYTGPLHFMQFWLDVIREWENRTGNDVLVGLSATKDVQDAILEDPARSSLIDLIDIRYWAYREDGSLYAPEGGLHMAPRQHARKIPPGKRSFEQVYRAVYEYRQAHPEKAVICSERGSMQFGWAVFMAGGSIPQLPAALPEGFLEDAVEMVPGKIGGEIPALSNKKGEMILYIDNNKKIEIDLSVYRGSVNVYWIDPETGIVDKDNASVSLGEVVEFQNPNTGPAVLWLTKTKI